ncbi:NADP-specific glutamate dehydrogenase [Cognatishimia sp. F0-27]|uniref:NADP-specific glutamate dehydrogenase n=1 Tax=Cognatishimia sp. F0-27 TaxID=2816855 RepID=UPI001D0BFF55|nr:NADP-specific glutamate dehydrogenase [Cognatishimia sp. F0-27]MCC1493873.1 NADP-specific glutamate dehydrogenase [Cognatishimia sp. F0-27]
MDRSSALTEQFLSSLPQADHALPNFIQAIREVATDVMTVEKNNADWTAARVLNRLAEPDRVISFRVTWEDDDGAVQINRGWRVQGSNVIGPYKGGLRFHPGVTLDDLRFLAFEQCFKNALTGLPLGGAKGGADFDPRGRSRSEIMRFCQAFMRALAPFIGPDKDVPAGDINVGTEEIGNLFGAWAQQAGLYQGALTGKGLSYGGSAVRTEATGYGLIYFLQAMLERMGEALEDKRIAISGKGNVARHAAAKAMALGAKVIALSDTAGTIHAADGLSRDALDWVAERKSAGESLGPLPNRIDAEFAEGATPWEYPADIALPCATQNEIDADQAQALVDNGVTLLAEGANMPTTADGLRVLRKHSVTYAPGKAANAGGVAVSGLEMSQMSQRRFMSADEVDTALKGIMADIHARVSEDGQRSGGVNYARGANVAAYRRLASAITAQGVL